MSLQVKCLLLSGGARPGVKPEVVIWRSQRYPWQGKETMKRYVHTYDYTSAEDGRVMHEERCPESVGFQTSLPV